MVAESPTLEERVGHIQQQLREISASLIGTRIDAHEGLLGQRRLEATLARVAEAVSLLSSRNDDPALRRRRDNAGRDSGLLRPRPDPPARVPPGHPAGRRAGRADQDEEMGRHREARPARAGKMGPVRARLGRSEAVVLEDEIAPAVTVARRAVTVARRAVTAELGRVCQTEGAAAGGVEEDRIRKADGLDLRLEERGAELGSEEAAEAAAIFAAVPGMAGGVICSEDRKWIKKKLLRALQHIRYACLRSCMYVCHGASTTLSAGKACAIRHPGYASAMKGVGHQMLDLKRWDGGRGDERCLEGACLC
jgi:hypothetical protein